VFTPPEFANRMLDTLAEAWAESNNGANIWADSTVTFLDPCTKSGVFLREITRRLTEGLAVEIPDLQERVDHILTKQVFGIAITRLTALMSRRSLYCSKHAKGTHSIAKSFASDNGNIWFERIEHTWNNGRCSFCGASAGTLDRSSNLETHAYAFIHEDDLSATITEMFGVDMQFDVIIGNPPYQLNDGGGAGTSASPLYHLFIRQAQELSPRYLSMVVPSKWFSGGKGLDSFRSQMLGDRRVRFIADYPNSRDAFEGVDVAGGVMYFLWDRDNPGTCAVETISGVNRNLAERNLDEYEVFIRDNRALEIVKRIQAFNVQSMATIVSARQPFGNVTCLESGQRGDTYIYASGGDGFANRDTITKGTDIIDKWKVLLSKTSSEHAGQSDRSGRKRVLSRIELMSPGTAATESYLIVGPFDSEYEAANAADYLRTRFVRFLVSTILLTQNITRAAFSFVPLQDFSKSWSDSDLFHMYGLTELDVDLIEKTIKPMIKDES
jgi:site-specific DNA-methyltransferase (adenine-specific)